MPGKYSVAVAALECLSCQPGYSQPESGATSCSPCSPGKYSALRSSAQCEFCPINTIQTKLNATTCFKCSPGTHTDGGTGKSTCAECGAGTYCAGECGETKGSSCLSCERGQFRTKKMSLARCEKCTKNQGANSIGATLCSPCSKGTFYLDGVCESCPIGYFSGFESSPSCQPCRFAETIGADNCVQTWVVADDCNDLTCLDDSNEDKKQWSCIKCPKGGDCVGPVVRRILLPLSGWWSIPWSNIPLFAKCPYADCLSGKEVLMSLNNVSNGAMNTTNATNSSILPVGSNETSLVVPFNGCRKGSTGVCCGVCETNFARMGIGCSFCSTEMVLIRACSAFGCVMVLVILLMWCRKKLVAAGKKYRKATASIIRILSIMVSFNQISTSLPSVINIDWPPFYVSFLSNLCVYYF